MDPSPQQLASWTRLGDVVAWTGLQGDAQAPGTVAGSWYRALGVEPGHNPSVLGLLTEAEYIDAEARWAAQRGVLPGVRGQSRLIGRACRLFSHATSGGPPPAAGAAAAASGEGTPGADVGLPAQGASSELREGAMDNAAFGLRAERGYEKVFGAAREAASDDSDASDGCSGASPEGALLSDGYEQPQEEEAPEPTDADWQGGPVAAAVAADAADADVPPGDWAEAGDRPCDDAGGAGEQEAWTHQPCDSPCSEPAAPRAGGRAGGCVCRPGRPEAHAAEGCPAEGLASRGSFGAAGCRQSSGSRSPRWGRGAAMTGRGSQAWELEESTWPPPAAARGPEGGAPSASSRCLAPAGSDDRGGREDPPKPSGQGLTSELEAWELEEGTWPPAPPPAAARGTEGGAPSAASRCLARAGSDDRGGQEGPPKPSGQGLASELEDGKWPPLLRVAYEGDVDRGRSLLRSGADVNVTAVGGGQKSPLYYAIRFEHIEFIKLLLSHPDVDVEQRMRSGRGTWTTPLEAAREAGRGSTVYRAFQERGLLPDPAAAARSSACGRGPSAPQGKRSLSPSVPPPWHRGALGGGVTSDGLAGGLDGGAATIAERRARYGRPPLAGSLTPKNR